MPRIGCLLAIGAALLVPPQIQAQPFGPPIWQAYLEWLHGKSDAPPLPFKWTRGEQRRIDRILMRWEQAGAKTNSFSCRFIRWDYDVTFGPKKHDYLMCERNGVLKFRAPDSGLFREDEIKMLNSATGKYDASRESLDHFCCDGKALYWLHPRVKTVDVIPLPKQWIGRATRDAPMPFLFPIEAKALTKRYSLRESTPAEHVGKQIWLEAWPRESADAASVQRYEVILTLPTYVPIAMQITLPNGKDRTAYLLEDYRVNQAAAVADVDFRPKPPVGWRVVHSGELPSSNPKEPTRAAPSTTPPASVSTCCPPISVGQNRSRANRGGLLRFRPVLPKFRHQGRVPCRNRCRCVRYCR